MGVTGLWTVVQPCARPIKLETLNKKRLAVDASIWIYQFLKAVRDKEGNALRNSHVVGFFRRICKLLYFGIRPVFVFDGGAPALKRQTIAARKKRREGRREDAARTAGKLLAVQMQRSAEEEAEARRRNQNRSRPAEEEVIGAPVYADEAFMTEREKQQTRKFKKKDAYHLPNLDVSLEEMGAPNDPRIMSQEELEEYARQFHQGQDINLYDFSKIDFDSPFFMSLPATDRYNILNAARLRSRLRMGYSKEQLDTMFPDRMAFSKFQIDRVKERNDLTQRLMNINGMNGEEAFYNSGQRIAGERGREYVLVKDSQHEGGWVLGVVGNKDSGQEDKPIDVDQYDRPEILSESEDVSNDEFEDVPIEGLNRLPKLPFLQEGVLDRSLQQAQEDSDLQRALYESHKGSTHDDSLFVEDDRHVIPHHGNRDTNNLFEDEDDEDDDLRRAINMSLEPNTKPDEDMPDISINRPTAVRAPHAPMLGSISNESDDEMDFAAAVAQTKVSKRKTHFQNPFSGPLPFESIKLTKSTEGVGQSAEIDDTAGGFVKGAVKTKKKTESLPPWFTGEQLIEEFITDRTNTGSSAQVNTSASDEQILFNRRSPDVIDVDNMPKSTEVIGLEEKKATGPTTHIEIISQENEHKLMEGPSVPRSSDAEAATLEPSAMLTETHGTIVEPVQGSPSDGADTSAIALQPIQVDPPEPDFEDVLSQPLLSAPPPEITVVSDERAELEELPSTKEIALSIEEDFSDPEDEDLLRQLAAEGEEYARFAQTLNSAAPLQDAFDYERELKQLRSQQQRDRRDADEVTQIMINECQQLLKLFGLPYVTAPMEAEAQCAELVSLGLVDGIVTDDSDTFLFGGTRVYKNMFNQSKYVECYLTSDFEKEYALHRRKLISFAHLLGSDYTEGIAGIGPVTALEIVTEFSSLEEFRDWWTQVQMGVNNPDDTHFAFWKKFRKKASKIFLPPSFPDAQVEAAYLEPEVDSDPSQFQWGVPDLNGLRHFLMATIGWSQERTDEILVPVIRDMNRREQEGTQSNITQFMQGAQGAGAFAPRVRSNGPSRMEKAFDRLRHEAQSARGDSHPANVAEDPSDRVNSSSRGKRETSNKAAKGSTSKKRKTRVEPDAA